MVRVKAFRILFIVFLLSSLASPGELFSQWVKLKDFGKRISAVYFIDLPGSARIGFVSLVTATYGSEVWRTTNGGSTWSQATLASATGGIRAFTFKDSLTGWFCSWGGYVFETRDGGLNWSPLAAPTWGDYDAIYYHAAAKRLLLSGDSGPYDYASTDDGTAWSQFNWGAVGQYCAFGGFAFANDTDGIVASWETYNFQRTTDGGKSWTASGQYPDGFQPAALSGTRTFFNASALGGRIRRSDDAGATWSDVPSSVIAGAWLNGSVEGDTALLVAQSQDKGVFVSVDRGRNWTGICGPNGHMPAYVKAYDIYAAESDTGKNSAGSILWKNTIDPQSVGGPKPLLSSDTLRLVTFVCGTLDSVLQYTLPANCPPILTAFDLSGSNVISLLNAPGLPHPIVGARDSLQIRYSPVKSGFDTAFLHLTFSNGTQTFDTTILIIGTANSAISSLEIFLPTVSGRPGDTISIRPGVLVSPISSLSLAFSYTIEFDRTLLSPIGLQSTALGNIRAVTVNDSLINGVPKDAPLRFIVGLGIEDSTTLVPGNLSLAAFCVPQTTFKSGVFRLLSVCPAGGERLFDPSVPVSLAQSSPNPASGIIHIGFSLTEQGTTELVLYDLLGRNVRTFVNSVMKPGQYTIDMNCSTLPAGAYIYVLRTPSQVLSKRLTISR